MKKNDISLEEQWKCVTNILERMQKRGGAILLIEQEILLNQLQGMYQGVLECAVATEQPLCPAEVEQRLSPATTATAPNPQPSGMPLPAPTPAAQLDKLIAATVACYVADHPVAVEQAETAQPTTTIVDTREEVSEPIVPQFARVPEEERITFNQPSMEELEGEQNKELFEEETTNEISFLEQPQPPATAQTETEAPMQTLEEEIPQPVAATPVNSDPTPQPKTSEQPKAEPSLFDLLTQSRGNTGGNTHTLGETLAQPAHNADTTPEQPQRNKVADLRTVININDKFSFMGELFHNNMKGYNDFISHLNALTHRDEALAYVAEIARQYKWNDESIAVKTFYTIFDRKF